MCWVIVRVIRVSMLKKWHEFRCNIQAKSYSRSRIREGKRSIGRQRNETPTISETDWNLQHRNTTVYSVKNNRLFPHFLALSLTIFSVCPPLCFDLSLSLSLSLFLFSHSSFPPKGKQTFFLSACRLVYIYMPSRSMCPLTLYAL